MKYDFVCEDCGHQKEVHMKANEFKEMKGEGVDCPECDGIAYNDFNPGELEVCWKGFQWADKNYREKKYRKERSKKMKKKQYKHNYVPKLSPNYKGEKTGSWKEAREQARKDGKRTETYDHLVEDEEDDPEMFAMSDAEKEKSNQEDSSSSEATSESD